MKLTDELKGKLENASEEEAKKILEETKKDVEDAGVILDDEDLDQIAGGSTDTPLWDCPDCGKAVRPSYVSYGMYACPCGHIFYKHWWEFWK